MENILSGVVEQVSSLNWALILSGVGIVEGVLGGYRKRGVNKVWAWAFPLFLGLSIGAVEYLAVHSREAFGVQYAAQVAESSLTYCGWVTFSYYFTLRPIKYAGDWIKRRSAGQ